MQILAKIEKTEKWISASFGIYYSIIKSENPKMLLPEIVETINQEFNVNFTYKEAKKFLGEVETLKQEEEYMWYLYEEEMKHKMFYPVEYELNKL